MKSNEPQKPEEKNPPMNLNTMNDLIQIKYNKAKSQKRLSFLFYTIGLCLSLLFVIVIFEWKFYNDSQIISLGSVDKEFEDLLEVPVTEQKIEPPPKIVQPKIVEVADEEDIIEDIVVDLDIEMTEDQSIEQIVYDYTEIDMEIEEEKADEIFLIVEEQPEPYGGIQTFYNYLSQNIIYPERAKENNIEGRVYVEFVVETDGTLSNIKTIKQIGGGCDEEVTRVVSLAPKWKPGKQRGTPRRVKIILPVLFNLENT